MAQKKDKEEMKEKRIISNGANYPFNWRLGNLDSNIVIENKDLNVQIKRYLITTSRGKILYDVLGINESLNNTVTIIRNQMGKIGLIWEWRPIPAKWFWACVRGFGDLVDNNNSETGKRELIEEIGNCEILNSKKIGVLYQNTTFYENPVGLVLIDVDVHNKKITTHQLNHAEGIFDFQFFDKREILEMIKNEKIEDTFTLSALIKYFSISD